MVNRRCYAEPSRERAGQHLSTSQKSEVLRSNAVMYVSMRTLFELPVSTIEQWLPSRAHSESDIVFNGHRVSKHCQFRRILVMLEIHTRTRLRDKKAKIIFLSHQRDGVGSNEETLNIQPLLGDARRPTLSLCKAHARQQWIRPRVSQFFDSYYYYKGRRPARRIHQAENPRSIGISR